MRIISFQIEHVKSIINSGVCHLSDTDNVMVFAGQNEAGKSAILEALNYFANGTNDRFVKLSKRLGKEPKVSCEFLLEEKDFNAQDNRVNDILREIKSVNCFRSGTADESKVISVSGDTAEKIKKLMEKIDFGVAKKVEEDQSNAAEVKAQEDAILKSKEDFLGSALAHIISSLPKFILYDS
ncbi:MAG: AAA family ATPase, partial [Candidatus Staskawiczbacteria bacterium]|nr:AAA family ATPase [Candidatus Staskawiczbacteria bacterium]